MNTESRMFSDICFITEDVLRLARFYESVFQTHAEGDAVHSVILTNGAGIALYSKQAAETDMGFDFSKYYGMGAMTIGYNVPDVDAEYERLKALDIDFISPPKTWPWGARSMHFRDPDGNIVCFRTVGKP